MKCGECVMVRMYCGEDVVVKIYDVGDGSVVSGEIK